MAMISAVRIGNMALSHVGAKSSIESFDQKGAEAAQIKLWYDYSRLQALQAYDWTFARRRKALALDGQDPPDEWLYRYKLPDDYVAARKIWNPLGDDADAIAYEMETNDDGVTTLLTNQEDAILIYTWDQQNTAVFSFFFVEMLSHLLAHHIAFSLTGKLDITNAQLQIYQGLVRSAPAYDGNAERAKAPRDAEWIRGR